MLLFLLHKKKQNLKKKHNERRDPPRKRKRKKMQNQWACLTSLCYFSPISAIFGAKRFFTLIPFFTMQNFNFRWGPLLPFWEFLKLWTNFVFWNFSDFFSLQNLGHCRPKQNMFKSVGLKMDEKQSVIFALFSTSLNPQRNTLTYSALLRTSKIDCSK